MNSTTHIAIIGAGISGLSLGYWLSKKGFKISIYEKSGHIGGSIVTEKKDGFLIDLGPNSTLETSEALKELVKEIGLEDEKVYGNEASNKRYILRNGTLMQVPMSPGSFLKTRLFSTGAKLRLLKEPFIKPTDGKDLSLADFVRYRLGNEFLDYAINPFVAGVYAGDPESLSTVAGFPKLHALEQKYGSFIKGAIKGNRERKKRKEVAKDRAKLFSFREGMEVFPNRLAEKIGFDNIHLNVEVQSILKDDSGFQLEIKKQEKKETVAADQVVCAMPARGLSEVVKILNPEASKAISNIYYPPVSVVFMGFKAEQMQRELDGFGYLIPEKEKRKILGTIWSSTILPGRAPEGHVALTTFVGGTRQPAMADLSEEDLKQMVLDELKDIIGITGAPVFTRLKKWPRAIPQYAVGYASIQQMYDDLEKGFPGLYIAGNIRKGISVGDSVLCAHDTVEKMMQSDSSN